MVIASEPAQHTVHAWWLRLIQLAIEEALGGDLSLHPFGLLEDFCDWTR